MMYVWAGIAVVVLFLIWQIIRWWNLPATIEARQKAADARAKRWSDWRANRPRLFARRKPATTPEPIPTPETPVKKPAKTPAPNTAEAIKRIEDEAKKEAKRDGLRERIKQRRSARRDRNGN